MSELEIGRMKLPPYGTTPAPSLSETSSFRQRLVRLDHETDFVTATESFADDLQLAHMINTVRNNIPHRNTIERFLSALRIVHDDNYEHGKWCSLDSAANQIFLRPEFHNALDRTGHFLIVGALECLQEAIQELARANRAWDDACRSNPHATRTINFRLACFTDTKFEILIMEASRGTRHVFHERKFAHHGRRIEYQIDTVAQSLVSTGLDGPPLPPFAAPPTDRTPCQRLNLLILTIHNAARFRTHHADMDRCPITNPRSLELERLINRLEDEIVHLPELHQPVQEEITVTAALRSLGRVNRVQDDKLDLKLRPSARERRYDPTRAAPTSRRHPGAAAFYDALPKPGEEVEELGTILDSPTSPPTSIDLEVEEVEAMRAKQDADWELAMSYSELPSDTTPWARA